VTLDQCIRGAWLLDGRGGPPRRADVGLADGRVAAVAEPGSLEADHVVEADGLTVTPGFIDLHGHSDVSLWQDPRGLSKLRQGITLEVIGNCGISPAPLSPLSREAVRPPQGVERFPWEGFGQYLSALEAARPAIHVAPLVGHGAIRRAVMGDAARPARPEELARQEELLRQALADGAFGFSTGLIYPPGVYTPTEELVALARAMARAGGGMYFTHLRSEGDGLLEAVDEALRIGKEGGVPVQLSHHKASGPRNWGKTVQSLARVEEARQAGQDVALDVYPYVASATSLSALLPSWALAGGREATLGRLAHPEERARIAAAVEAAEGSGGYGRTRVCGLRRPEHRALEGLTVEAAARHLGLAPVDALLELLRSEDLAPGMIRFGMDEADVRRVLAYPATLIGTDAAAVAPDGPEGRQTVHPRAYGTFPRVLAHYVRREGVLSLPEAIARMTGQAARRLGLTDRGVVAPGMWADLVLLDPDQVEDRATWELPHRFPDGILGVWVNGQRAVDPSGATGVRAGRVLRRPRPRG
jgi:N-acyl-D-amino-acid deacylase